MLLPRLFNLRYYIRLLLGLSNLRNRGLLEDLPEELLAEILRRFPVQSLLRLRCVCKTWKCLIDSSIFIKYHLSKNPNSKIYLFVSSLRGYVEVFGGEVKFAEVDLLNRSGGLTFQSLTLPLPLKTPAYPPILRVYGSCDGLICLATSHLLDMASRNGPSTTEFLLVNPSTREYRLLPPICLMELWCETGLGYDCSADEYKLVVIPDQGTEVYIYGSKSNTWRQINVSSKYSSTSVSQPRYGKYTHGVLHWIGFGPDKLSDSEQLSDHDMNTFSIVEFDIVSEKFTVAEYNSDLFGNPENVFLEVLGG